MTHSTTMETTPTYHWATAAGAVASISGLVALAVCIYASVSNRTSHGYAPVPNGIIALAVVMTLGGLVLVLFRILHGDREATYRRVDAIVEHLEKHHAERKADLYAMELDRIRREYAREPIVAAGLAEAVLDEVRPLVATLHEGVVAKVQRVTEGLVDLLEELQKIRVRQAHADEVLVAVEVEMKELETLWERVGELERELSQVADAPITDLTAARTLRSIQRRLGSED